MDICSQDDEEDISHVMSHCRFPRMRIQLPNSWRDFRVPSFSNCTASSRILLHQTWKKFTSRPCDSLESSYKSRETQRSLVPFLYSTVHQAQKKLDYSVSSYPDGSPKESPHLASHDSLKSLHTSPSVDSTDPCEIEGLWMLVMRSNSRGNPRQEPLNYLQQSDSYVNASFATTYLTPRGISLIRNNIELKALTESGIMSEEFDYIANYFLKLTQGASGNGRDLLLTKIFYKGCPTERTALIRESPGMARHFASNVKVEFPPVIKKHQNQSIGSKDGRKTNTATSRQTATISDQQSQYMDSSSDSAFPLPEEGLDFVYSLNLPVISPRDCTRFQTATLVTKFKSTLPYLTVVFDEGFRAEKNDSLTFINNKLMALCAMALFTRFNLNWKVEGLRDTRPDLPLRHYGIAISSDWEFFIYEFKVVRNDSGGWAGCRGIRKYEGSVKDKEELIQLFVWVHYIQGEGFDEHVAGVDEDVWRYKLALSKESDPKDEQNQIMHEEIHCWGKGP